MAVSEQRILPPEFIEAAGKTYLDDLSKATGQFKAADLSKTFGPQFVAGPGALQTQAEGLAGGLGSFQPFLQTAASQAGQAGQFMGPQAYQQFMSPFQQDVIDTTLSEFDRQAQRGLTSIADQALAAGAFGGGREGVQRAEYQAASDRNRAALQAQLLSQGFGQAQQAAAQAFGQQQNLAQQQQNLAQLAPQLAGQQIAGLSTLGAQQQAQEQAKLTAQQQLAQQQLNQPLQAAQQYGSGVTSLIAGYPGKDVITQQPGPSPVSTALGIGSTLAGIYRAFNPTPINIRT
jgi:hypothetical protein